MGSTGVAILLLLIHRVTDYDYVLAGLALVYGGCTVAAVRVWPALQASRLAWGLDIGATLALVLLAEQWRSPFYLMALTSLVLPAATLPLRRSLQLGGAFTLAYLAIAFATGIDFPELRSTARLESFATHLLVPILVTLALGYAAALLEERSRSERLAVEAERRRIAWELHDSAKQRVHAAHLILTTLDRQLGGRQGQRLVGQAVGELRAATADMDTSLSELQAPLGGRGLGEALRERARELEAASGTRIDLDGDAPELPTFVAAHAFRVASEALANAIRHARATSICVRLGADSGRLRVMVSDDGRGMPARVRPGSHGLHAMAARAETLGGTISVGAGPGGAGTAVELSVPVDAQSGE